MQNTLDIDLHGYHPDSICGKPLERIVEHAWFCGVESLRLIHGHGRNRGISPGFVNTNTGYFGLRLRQELRHSDALRQWIKHTTLDCSDKGVTEIRLKPNPRPSQKPFNTEELLPKRLFSHC